MLLDPLTHLNLDTAEDGELERTCLALSEQKTTSYAYASDAVLTYFMRATSGIGEQADDWNWHSSRRLLIALRTAIRHELQQVTVPLPLRLGQAFLPWSTKRGIAGISSTRYWLGGRMNH
jgi:hypothetical protein